LFHSTRLWRPLLPPALLLRLSRRDLPPAPRRGPHAGLPNKPKCWREKENNRLARDRPPSNQQILRRRHKLQSAAANPPGKSCCWWPHRLSRKRVLGALPIARRNSIRQWLSLYTFLGSFFEMMRTISRIFSISINSSTSSV